MTGRGGRERGSGTVLVVGVAGVLLILLTGTSVLLSAVLASHRARAAADLAALAAAGVLLDPGSAAAPCPRAELVARLGGARLVGCRAIGDTVQVSVRVTVGWPGVRPATARARAGPAPEP